MTAERAKYAAEVASGLRGRLPQPYPRTIGPNAMKYLREVVESGLTVNMVGRFEDAFAEEMGVKHCIATPGCTPALSVLAAAFGFEPGDEVIIPALTVVSTAFVTLHQNAVPVFADIDQRTFNIDPADVARKITPRTKAVIPVGL